MNLPADQDDPEEPDFESEPPESAAFEIDVCDAQTRLAVDREAIRGLAERVLRGEGMTAATISLAIVDDPTIHRINRDHLNHDEPTDVITFDLSDEGDDRLRGELVVSAETAARVAGELGAEPWNELALYVVHGLLHLCGCDDLDEDSAAEMRRREEAAMARLGLTNPFPLGAARRPPS